MMLTFISSMLTLQMSQQHLQGTFLMMDSVLDQDIKVQILSQHRLRVQIARVTDTQLCRSTDEVKKRVG